MKILPLLCLIAGALVADEIEVEVDGTIQAGGDDIFYLYFEPEASGGGEIKKLDREYYDELFKLFDEAGHLGDVGSLRFELLQKDGRPAGHYLWRAWRELRVPQRQGIRDRTLALYFRAIDLRTGYEVRYFPGAVEDLSQKELNEIFRNAEKEGRKQAEKIAKAQGKTLGKLLKTKWLNSGALTGINPEEVGRVYLRLTFEAL